MKIVVASGKGGVGKSMVASSLAILFAKEYKTVACDCDVDAPNMALWLGVCKDDVAYSKGIAISEKAKINEKCNKCGLCRNACKFDAIELKDGKYAVNELLCEGCGACMLVCKSNAIELYRKVNAEILVASTKYNFPLIYAQLHPGETGSGKVVEELRKTADNFDYEVQILDASAGIGCSVIASLKNCDLAILAAEPTPSAASDLKRVIRVVDHFNVPFYVILNKVLSSDSYLNLFKFVEDKIIAKIPYDLRVIECLINKTPPILKTTRVTQVLEQTYNKIKELSLL